MVFCWTGALIRCHSDSFWCQQLPNNSFSPISTPCQVRQITVPEGAPKLARTLGAWYALLFVSWTRILVQEISSWSHNDRSQRGRNMAKDASPQEFNKLSYWNSFFVLHWLEYYDFLTGSQRYIAPYRNTVSVWESEIIKLLGLLSCWYPATLSISYIQIIWEHLYGYRKLQSSHSSGTQFWLMLTSYGSMVNLSQSVNQYSYISSN